MNSEFIKKFHEIVKDFKTYTDTKQDFRFPEVFCAKPTFIIYAAFKYQSLAKVRTKLSFSYS